MLQAQSINKVINCEGRQVVQMIERKFNRTVNPQYPTFNLFYETNFILNLTFPLCYNYPIFR